MNTPELHLIVDRTPYKVTKLDRFGQVYGQPTFQIRTPHRLEGKSVLGQERILGHKSDFWGVDFSPFAVDNS